MTTMLVIAKNTFGEAIRRKILNVFLIVALAMIALSFSFSQFSFREELTILKGMGLGIIAIVGMLIVLVMGINLISTEIERRTIYTILAKPVRRHEYLLGKFLGALATLGLNILLISLIFLIMITWKAHWKFEPQLIGGLVMIFFQLLLLGAVTMVFAVFTTPVVNFFLTVAVYIVGNLSDYTMTMMRSDNPIVQWFYTIVHYVIPNFANFNVQNPLIHPEAMTQSPIHYYGENILLALVYVCALLIVSILMFERRDM